MHTPPAHWLEIMTESVHRMPVQSSEACFFPHTVIDKWPRQTDRERSWASIQSPNFTEPQSIPFPSTVKANEGKQTNGFLLGLSQSALAGKSPTHYHHRCQTERNLYLLTFLFFFSFFH